LLNKYVFPLNILMLTVWSHNLQYDFEQATKNCTKKLLVFKIIILDLKAVQ
jgi:hypothetical protein